MKTRLVFIPLLFASWLLTVGAVHAQSPDTSQPVRELPLVVVDTIQQQQGAITDFDRIEMAFEHVAKERGWPVTIVGERFAANTPAYDTELRVFNRPVREETSGDRTFRGWITLTVNGTKHDFGMVTFRYYPRGGEHHEDVLQNVFRGAANVAAAKIEPLLFPGLDTPKR